MGSFTSFQKVQRTTPKERLELLNSIKKNRLAQPTVSPHRMEDICNQIPAEISDIQSREYTGYHTECYKNFTKNLEYITPSEAFSAQQGNSKHSP